MSRKERVANVVMLLGAVSMLASCSFFYPTKVYRYRLTIEGVHGGSAVYEVLAEKNRFRLLADETAGGSLLRGEALAIETDSGPVFATLKSVDQGDRLLSVVTHALAPDIPKGGHDNFWEAVSRLGSRADTTKAELPRDGWPIIIRFRDLEDSSTAEEVSPEAIGLRRIWVETTNEPVTTGIERRLSWIENGGLPLDRSGPTFTLTPSTAQTLSQRDFSTMFGL